MNVKNTLIFGLTLLLAAGAWAGQAAAGSPGSSDKPSGVPALPDLIEQKAAAPANVVSGSALLDLFIDNMRTMARTGTPADLDKHLQEMMLAARKSKEAGVIDAVFFFRYGRMLAVFKLVAVPDATGILVPVIDDYLGAFVRDKLGHGGFTEAGGKGPQAINYVAQALSVELVDLQIYLDTVKERADLTKTLEERMQVGPAKK
jgi:hypothetical protein